MNQAAQMSSSTQPGPPPLSSPTIPRKRRATACERCHKRRVRCDASLNGVPCFECKRSSNSENCRLVQSKRTRGPDGRFILPDEMEAQAFGSTMPEGSGDGSRAVERGEPPLKIPRTDREPEISLDLAKLVGAEHEHRLGGDSDESPGTVSIEARDDDDSRTQPDTRASFVGESWYASYVLSTSVAGHAQLHRPIERRPKGLSPGNHPPHSGQDASSAPGKPQPSDLPPQNLTERLLEAYFKRFHVFFPVLDRVSFLSSVRDGTVSITLLRCVLFVASIHCEPQVFHLMGYSRRVDVGDDLFGKACASFDADQEADRTTMVLSSFLLHYYFGKPTFYRDTLWWLATAIRSAQCMGFHRSTVNSRMPQKDKAQWRRIWWCLYIRDRQLCLSTGAPMVINDLDHDVENLTMEDFPDESPETARYMIAQVGLNQAASNMYFRHCSPSRLHLNHDPLVRQNARREIQATLEDWYENAPINSSPGDSHYLTLTAKVCYHYYIINLQQRLERLCPKNFTDPEGSKVILDAANNVSALVEDSLLYWTPEHFPIIYISAIFTAMIAHVADCGVSGPRRQRLAQKLRPNLLALKQLEQCYMLAHWIRGLFMDIIDRPDPSRGPVKKAQRSDSRANEEHSTTPNGLPLNQAGINGGTAYISGAATTPTDHSFSVGETPLPQQFTSSDRPAYLDVSVSQEPHDSAVETSLSSLFPHFITNDYFTPPYGVTEMTLGDYPSPSSLEYQSFHFLADLGLSGYSEEPPPS